MESHLNIYCKIITSFSSICPNKNLMLYFDCIWVYGNPYHASDPRHKINRDLLDSMSRENPNDDCIKLSN